MDEVSLIPRRGNLTESVINALSSRIDTAAYPPGRKLPSEQELCREFGVSRTVIREAVASLRLGGKLYSRQGLGVFVTERDARRLGFDLKADQDARSALHILELRLGIETEAVALARARHHPVGHRPGRPQGRPLGAAPPHRGKHRPLSAPDRRRRPDPPG